MTGEHAMRHFKELRTGDTLDAYTGRDGRHRGAVLAVTTAAPAAPAAGGTTVTTVKLDCTVCAAEHLVADSPWRLVAAVRKP